MKQRSQKETVGAALDSRTECSAREACGCPRTHLEYKGHNCIVHDEHGKRWDAYTFDDLAKLHYVKVEVQDRKSQWSCYCGRHKDDIMPVGTKCIWLKTSYEYDEWECECADSYRQKWLDAQTTDWIAMMKEDETQLSNASSSATVPAFCEPCLNKSGIPTSRPLE